LARREELVVNGDRLCADGRKEGSKQVRVQTKLVEIDSNVLPKEIDSVCDGKKYESRSEDRFGTKATLVAATKIVDRRERSQFREQA